MLVCHVFHAFLDAFSWNRGLESVLGLAGSRTSLSRVEIIVGRGIFDQHGDQIQMPLSDCWLLSLPTAMGLASLNSNIIPSTFVAFYARS
ncbi:hypothetical protein M0R45_027782 [Rubus argutus]|uniref:Uncharacterized protein n=1 Tax=Rubus argutus TaxID=59490 RepID=A0AAW1X1D3_RUBAR